MQTNTAALIDFTLDYDEDGAGGGGSAMDEDELFAHQTRALPDIVPQAVRPPQVPGDSTVTERLDSNRRERHDVAVEEMHQDLDALRLETEASNKKKKKIPPHRYLVKRPPRTL